MLRIVQAPVKPSTLEALQQIFADVPMLPSKYFFSNRFLNTDDFSEYNTELPKELLLFIRFYLNWLKKILNICENSNESGFEVWSSSLKKSKNDRYYVHVDNDEFLRTNTGRVRNPLHGSIFYVSDKNFQVGGRTYFSNESGIPKFKELNQEEFDSYSWQCADNSSGNVVLFDGDLPHCVEPFTCRAGFRRTVLLANYWDSRILTVDECIHQKISGSQHERI